jgi:hypothetical protein
MKTSVWIVIGTLVVSSSVFAADSSIGRGAVAVGFNYPGLGIRYFPFDRYAVEIRGQYETGAFSAGGRFYTYFGPITHVFPYAGLEVDYASLKGKSAGGQGVVAELLVGGEIFLLRKVSFQFDFGPSYVYLKNYKNSISVSGVEYIVNFGLNYYFGRGNGTETSARSRETPTAQSVSPDVESLYREAANLYTAGDHDAAARSSQRIIDIDSGHWRAWALLGNCHYAKGKREEALAAYSRSLEINPDNPQLRAWVEKMRQEGSK